MKSIKGRSRATTETNTPSQLESARINASLTLVADLDNYGFLLKYIGPRVVVLPPFLRGYELLDHVGDDNGPCIICCTV